jgi:hypothetical protein
MGNENAFTLSFQILVMVSLLILRGQTYNSKPQNVFESTHIFLLNSHSIFQKDVEHVVRRVNICWVLVCALRVTAIVSRPAVSKPVDATRFHLHLFPVDAASLVRITFGSGGIIRCDGTVCAVVLQPPNPETVFPNRFYKWHPQIHTRARIWCRHEAM